MVPKTDSAVASWLMAMPAAATSSVAAGPMMWTPRISPYYFSVTTFTKPVVLPRMLALPFAVHGKRPTFTS